MASTKPPVGRQKQRSTQDLPRERQILYKAACYQRPFLMVLCKKRNSNSILANNVHFKTMSVKKNSHEMWLPGLGFHRLLFVPSRVSVSYLLASELWRENVPLCGVFVTSVSAPVCKLNALYSASGCWTLDRLGCDATPYLLPLHTLRANFEKTECVASSLLGEIWSQDLADVCHIKPPSLKRISMPPKPVSRFSPYSPAVREWLKDKVLPFEVLWG